MKVKYKPEILVIRFYCLGITIQRIKYKISPGKPAENTDKIAYNTRTKVVSQPKYSAIPAHTPAII